MKKRLGPFEIDAVDNVSAVITRACIGVVVASIGMAMRLAGVWFPAALLVLLTGMAVLLSTWRMPNMPYAKKEN